MKNPSSFKFLKFSILLLIILVVSSCSNETDDFFNIEEVNATAKTEQLMSRPAPLSTAFVSSIVVNNSVICVNQEQTFTLSGWNGGAALNVQIFNQSTLTWVTIDSFNGQNLSPQTMNYTFSTVGTYLLRYQVSGKSSDGGTNGFIEFSVVVVDCTVNVGCSLSQGYWFSKPNIVWGTNVDVGGYSYTQAEGAAIWNSSNSGGIKDTKKCFLQVAAIKLSGSSVLPTDTVWQDVKIVEDWLKTIPKVTGSSTESNQAAAQAAGRIGDWINANHCED